MEDKNPSNPADPDPRNQGDSKVRAGLWKLGLVGPIPTSLKEKKLLDKLDLMIIL